MFTFHDPPTQRISSDFGVSLSPEWLDNLRLSSVRLNDGGSGAFISSDGLVLTNHHVALGQLGKMSDAQTDYVKDGFYAHTPEEEIPVKDLEMNVLVSMENVTDRVQRAITPGASDAEANRQRKAEISRIEKESMDLTGLRSDVVTLYEGGQYWLYRYKKYTDIRLVMAPEKAAAFFGGDYDNFSYPRYALDFAFFRVYEDGKPLHSDHFLPLSEIGPKEGELVLVSGHPGSTNRLKTLSQLHFIQDLKLPGFIENLEAMKKALEEYSALGAEEQRQAETKLFSINNSLKRSIGQREGLKEPSLWEKKGREEKELRAAVENDPELASRYGQAWDRIANAQEIRSTRYGEELGLDALLGSRLASIAHTLAQYHSQVEKPNDERYPEYRDTALESLQQRLFSTAPIYPAMEERLLITGVELALKHLGPEHPLLKKALADKTPEEFAKELVDGTRLTDPKYRRQLALEAGAIEASDDPLIVFFREAETYYRSWRQWFEDEIESVEALMGNFVARGRAAIYGNKLPPDANFTLRLSYGVVKGYEQLGTILPAWTTFFGLFDRARSFGDHPPFRLPERVARAEKTLDLTTPMNAVNTSDTIGGNSGSPVVNAAGELVGLNFDSNFHKLANSYGYIAGPARAIIVHSRAIRTALRKIYGMDRLADEITRRPDRNP